jgi:hypothetical protein
MPPFLPEPDIRTTMRRDIVARKEVNQELIKSKHRQISENNIIHENSPTTEHEDG